MRARARLACVGHWRLKHSRVNAVGDSIHPPMSSLPPRNLCIAGALFIAMGAGAVAGMIASLIEGRYSFNLGFVFIPLGYGILIGRASSRKWTLILAIGGLAGLAGSGGCAAYEQWQGGGVQRPLSPDDVCAMAEWIFGMAFCLYLTVVFTRDGNREWFATEKEYRPAVKSLAWAAAVVGAVFCFGQSLDEWRVHERYEKAQPFRVRVIPYHAVTGNGMTTLSYRCEAGESSNEIKSKLPKVDAIFIGGKEGPQYEFHGQAAQPFEVTLKSEGFEDKVITLCGKAEYEIRVPMQPLVPTQAKRGADGKPAAPDVKE